MEAIATPVLRSSSGHEVPLTGVRFTSQISAGGHRTVVDQVFINREGGAIEAVYSFPLPEGAAVCGFEAITGERVLTGVMEEADAGMQKYDDAVAEGHGAFMAELWRPDVFSTRLGNIKAGQAVRIRLTYLAEIRTADRSMRVTFPTTLAPRYVPASSTDPAADDALNPPHVVSIPYGLEFSATVELGNAVQAVQSPSHALAVNRLADGQWSLSLAAGLAEMNRELVVTIQLAAEPEPSARVGADPATGEQFVAVDFVPPVDGDSLAVTRARDIVFLLDCSGSMEGPSIEQAKVALSLCLKSLNEGDRFNICRFGSRHEWMQGASAVYSQQTLDAAMRYVGTIHADLGGTEILAPLQETLRLSAAGRDIILLTDGQVSNEPEVVQAAAGHGERVRIFPFGIGPAPSAFLINGLATSTGGVAEFIAANERIEEKVLRTFARMSSPAYDHVSLAFFPAAESDLEPREAPAVYEGDMLSLIARLGGGRAPESVTLTARRGETTRAWSIPIRPVGDRSLGQRWARRRLQRLEQNAAVNKGALVELSKRYGVLCKETTMLAIEHRSVEERTAGRPALRKVPVLLAKGWGGMDGLAANVVAPCCTVPAPHGAAVYRSMPAPASPPMAKPEQAERRSALYSMGPLAGGVPRDEKESQPSEPLIELLLGQTADGSFPDDPRLHSSSLNGQSFDAGDLTRQLAALRLAPAAIATALTLHLFARCFADRADLWRAAAKKGRRWLATHAPEALGWLDAQVAGAMP